MGQRMKNARFWMVVVLLSSTALLLHTRGDTEFIPVSRPLSQLPRLLDGWTGSEVAIDREELNVLGPGDFLARIYRLQETPAPIGLFIGYFRSQRTGGTIHSPKNCLPGAGWNFQSSQYLFLKDGRGESHQVGEYIVAKGDTRQVAIYWYQAHGRSVASEYMAKLYLVADAMRLNRSDGALVRVTTPVLPGESIAQAETRAEAFTAQLLPALPPFIPN
jgi:EpsI family protein